MNSSTFTFDDLASSLDSAIDRLNTEWRIDIPMITDFPETKVDVTTGNVTPVDYTALPNEFIRQYVIPYTIYRQYIVIGQDGSPEMQEALLQLAALSERYPVDPGATEISTKNFNILTEDTTDQFADGNSNYGEPVPKNPIDPLGDY